MKRLKLVSDNVFGTLLQAGLGFRKPVKGKIHIVLLESQVDMVDQADYVF